MSGTSRGGLKAAKKNIEKDKDFYSHIGSPYNYENLYWNGRGM